jgi:peptide methionine sulfoxide reductase MsrA
MQVAGLCLQSAEDYRQQYLYKVPNGYCPNHSTERFLAKGQA